MSGVDVKLASGTSKGAAMSTNYCAHALECRDSVVSWVTGAYGEKPGKLASGLYDRLRDSVKFRLPDNGSILGLSESDQRKAVSEFLDIPYPCLALEYTMTDERVGEGQVSVPHRILLVFRTGHEEFPISVFFFGKFADLPGINWMPNLVGMMVSRDGRAILSPIAPLPEQVISALGEDIRSDIEQLAEFLAAFSCVNVEAADCPPPSPKLNRKRSERGKVPFFTYKTLVLDVGIKASGSDQGGSHASPRVHLRRGHIRRLPKGPVWVNATVVGDKSRGMVVKDYRVSQSAA